MDGSLELDLERKVEFHSVDSRLGRKGRAGIGQPDKGKVVEEDARCGQVLGAVSTCDQRERRGSIALGLTGHIQFLH
jgi:hypothetical protein